MGFFGSILSAAIKVVLTPVAVAADIIDVVDGEAPINTTSLLGSAGEDVVDAIGSAL